MSLIAMAVWDTVENQRSQFTKRTIENLLKTVNFDKHRLIIVDNHSCQETHDIYATLPEYHPNITVVYLDKNMGTAEAVNVAWLTRNPGENAIKMDNDVVVYQTGWVDQLDEAIKRDPRIGIIGLKRKDLEESPDTTNPFYKSKLVMLPHKKGEKWIVVEEVNHVMGTCQMYSSALLDRIGYLKQPGIYGFDDALSAIRCKIAGYKNVFLPHILIDHIDPGDKPYQKWKENHAGEYWPHYQKLVKEYESGKQDILHNPFATK